jgi:tetratricopeptide (TPR) repeat protein
MTLPIRWLISPYILLLGVCSLGIIATTAYAVQESNDALLKRCQEALKGLDGKSCYHWARNPPRWARPIGKNSENIEPFLFKYAMEQAVERDPKLAAAHLALGDLAHINKAIELLPQFAGGYWARGNYYHFRNEHKQAEADYTKAIDLIAGNKDHRLEVDGQVYELHPAQRLSTLYRDRAMARLLQGNHAQIAADMEKVLAEVDNNDAIMGSFYLLQVAWISSVNPEPKIRSAKLAREFIAKAEQYESKLSADAKSTPSIALWHRVNIVKAACAAESGDFEKAVELESKVSYGSIQWGDPDAAHHSRLAQYKARKPIRTSQHWYLSAGF